MSLIFLTIPASHTESPEHKYRHKLSTQQCRNAVLIKRLVRNCARGYFTPLYTDNYSLRTEDAHVERNSVLLGVYVVLLDDAVAVSATYCVSG